MAELSVPQVDFSALGQLPQIYKQGQDDANVRMNLANLGQGAAADAQTLMKSGNMSLVQLGATLQNHQDTLHQQEIANARQAVQDKLTQEHWGSDYALRKAASERADEEKYSYQAPKDGGAPIAFNPRTGEAKPIALPASAVQDTSLGGPDFLASLPSNRAAIVKKIADHEVDPNKLSIVGGHRESLIADASRYDPEYDASLAPARFAAKKEFLTGGPNAPSSTIVSGGTTIGHLLHASDASQKLGGTNSFGPLNSTINSARAAYEQQSNDPNFKEYNTTIGRIAEEGTKFYRGVGGTESDIMRDIQTMQPGQSQESRDRALATQASLIYSKVAALQDRYKNAMGTKAWEKVSKENNFPVISAKNREAVNTILKRGGLPELPPEPPQNGAASQGNGSDVLLQHARDAIALGAPKDAVLKRLQEGGVDPSGL